MGWGVCLVIIKVLISIEVQLKEAFEVVSGELGGEASILWGPQFLTFDISALLPGYCLPDTVQPAFV